MACFCQVHLSVHPRSPCLRCSYLCMATSHTHDVAICYTTKGGSKKSHSRRETVTAKSVRTASITNKLFFKVLLTGESVQLRGFLAVSSTRISRLVSCLPQNNRVQLRPENALLVCVPSKWAVMTLPRINETNIPVLYRPPQEHRLVKHSALLGCSDSWVTDSQRFEGKRHPHIQRSIPCSSAQARRPASSNINAVKTSDLAK